MPAVREIRVCIEVIQAVVTALIARRVTSKHSPLDEVLQRDPVLLVDLFWLWRRDLVLRHASKAT